MTSKQLSDAFDFDMPDPNEIQAGEDTQFQKDSLHPQGAQQGTAISQRGFTQMAGGSPEVQNARRMQDLFGQILTNVNATAPDNEDPYDKQARIARAVSTQFASVNPKIAMSANDALIKLQQAKTQQSYLSAKTADENAAALGKRADDAVRHIASIDPQTQQITSYGSVQLYDPMTGKPNPTSDEEIADAKQKAADAGVTDTGLYSDKTYLDAKSRAGDLKAQSAIQVAQLQAAAKLQAAANHAVPLNPMQQKTMTEGIAQEGFTQGVRQLAGYVADNPLALTEKNKFATFLDKVSTQVAAGLGADGTLSPSEELALQSFKAQKLPTGNANPAYLSNPAVQSMLTQLAFMKARANVGGRITQVEINWARQMLGGDSPDPKVLIHQLGVVAQGAQMAWESRVRAAPTIMDHPSSADGFNNVNNDLSDTVSFINNAAKRLGGPGVNPVGTTGKANEANSHGAIVSRGIKGTANFGKVKYADGFIGPAQ